MPAVSPRHAGGTLNGKSSHPYSRRGARRSLIDTVAFRAVSQVATILGYIVIVRSMAEHDFGILSLLYAFIPVVSTLASLGLEQTLRRYQPEYLRAGRKDAASWLVRFVAASRLATNVAVIALVLLLWNLVAPLFHLAPYRAEFAMFSVLILLQFQSRILQLSLASHMLHRYSVGSMAMLPIVKLAGYLCLAWFAAFSLRAAILVDTLAFGAAYAFLSFAYRRHCTLPAGTAPSAPDRIERRRLLRYGLFNNFNDAGAMILDVRSDNFFIAALLNPIAVGAYSFFNRLNEMVANVSPARLFDNVIQPMFFAIPREQAESRVPRYFTLMLNVNLVLQLAALAFASAYHRDIVNVLFGGKFIDYSPLLPVILGFAAMNVIAVPVTLAAQYAEKAAVILLGKVTVVYQIAATLLLIPVLGLYGAAIASGTAQLFKNLFVWWHVRHTARWLNFRSVLFMSLLIWGSAAGLCLAARRWLDIPAVAHLLLGASVCAAAALVHLRSPAISASDREVLGSVLHGREAGIMQRLGILRAGSGR